MLLSLLVWIGAGLYVVAAALAIPQSRRLWVRRLGLLLTFPALSMILALYIADYGLLVAIPAEILFAFAGYMTGRLWPNK